MPSIADRRARVSRSIDRVLAASTRVIPMTGGLGYVQAMPDADRPHFEARGAVLKTSSLSRREGANARSSTNVDTRSASYRVSYAQDAFGGNQAPQKGDRIVLLEEPGAPTMVVSHLEPPEASHGRHIVHLAKVSP